jgi:rubrerythrin
MPEFVNPFSGKVPDRKLTDGELIRAIRLNIAAEHEAIHLYMAHADATDHPLAKKVLIDVANEERQHVGEFSRLLQVLTGDEDKWVGEGVEEVQRDGERIRLRTLGGLSERGRHETRARNRLSQMSMA